LPDDPEGDDPEDDDPEDDPEDVSGGDEAPAPVEVLPVVLEELASLADRLSVR